jgi:hypothetical protein
MSGHSGNNITKTYINSISRLTLLLGPPPLTTPTAPSPPSHQDDILAAISDLNCTIPSDDFEPNPQTWAEAQSSTHGSDWCKCFQDELDSLKSMGVYILVPQSEVPTGQKIHRGMPIFHVKWDANGAVYRRKTHLKSTDMTTTKLHLLQLVWSPSIYYSTLQLI